MDTVFALATTHASLDQRMARAEATIEYSHAMLLQIMSHLSLLLELTQTTRDQSVAAASLDMLAAAAAASDPPAHPPPRELGGHTPFSNFPIPTQWRHVYTLVGRKS